MNEKDLKLGFLFRVRNRKCLSFIVSQPIKIMCIFKIHSSVINLQPIKEENWGVECNREGTSLITCSPGSKSTLDLIFQVRWCSVHAINTFSPGRHPGHFVVNVVIIH